MSIGNAQMKVTKIDNSNVIEVGKISPMGTLHAVIEKHNDFYILTYNDGNYKEIDEYKSFKIGLNDIDNLYLVINNPEAKVGDTYHIELLDKNTLTIIFSKALGTIYPAIYHKNKIGIEGRVPHFTKKQWAKLFGKK